MPRSCTICSNSKRKEIEAEMVRGEPMRGVSRKFAVSEDALARHRAHLAKAVVKAAERHEERVGDSLLNQIRQLTFRAWALLDRMEAEGDLRGAVIGLRETRETLTALNELLERTAPATGSHPSPCPHCDAEEFRAACTRAVRASLGFDSGGAPALPDGGAGGADHVQ